MQEKKWKRLVHHQDIGFLAILTPIIYIGVLVLLVSLKIIRPVLFEEGIPYLPYLSSFFVALGVDILWVIIMKSYRLEAVDLRKRLLISLESVSLAVAITVIYVGSLMLLIDPINLMGNWVSTPSAFFIVLGFDVAWIITMILWPLKNTHIKVLLTLLILTLSASILTCCVGVFLLGDFTY